MNHLKSCFYSICFSFCLVTPSFAANADDNTARDDSQVYHIYKNIDLVTNLKTLSNKEPKFFVKSVFPQLESDIDDPNVTSFNNLVSQMVQQEIITFQHNVAQNQKTLVNLPKEASRNSTLYVDYDTSTIKSGDDHIISVRFTMQGYLAGMAHPFHYHRVLNYNIDAGEKIELADLFKPQTDYLTLIASFAKEDLNRRLSDKASVEAGAAPTLENYKNWNIKPNGLLITFDEYQVAPYVNGAQAVIIPYALLKSILDTESPLSDCIKNKKTCLRSNVLTGGFIDTASNSTHLSLNPAFREV